ncbi:hypothetical protein GCU68_13560 [Natronorubrum aibiense]|uniref:Twin-arginine translocation signal domain-containing protein n=2 Tax=Natronorubrum aibiense TaxID=348826 RepID=A0A5P9P5Q3_9EURY|nr:hypothetical protein GCU68_13560 [Natronorubrum aibiense]
MAMPEPSRRSVLQALGGVGLGVAASRQPQWPGFFGGYIEAAPLEPLLDADEHDDQLPPDEFVTPHDDDLLVGLDPLHAALERPDEHVTLSRREFGATFTALEELPVFYPHRHEGHDHPAVARGLYSRDLEYTYRVQLVPWCSDAWWIRTRGTPEGWASCRER